MNKQDPVLRIMPMPKDTNRYGTVFGGVILSYLDLAGVLEARKTAPMNYVTVAMNKVEFHQPVFVGDQVSFYTRTIRKGKTSITVEVYVEASRYENPAELVHVTSAEITYVAVDENRKPVLIPVSSPQ